MQVHIAPNEVWPVFAVENAIGKQDSDTVEVPSEMVTDWMNAKSEVEKAEQRILDHLKRTGQSVPEAFGYRMDT